MDLSFVLLGLSICGLAVPWIIYPAVCAIRRHRAGPLRDAPVTHRGVAVAAVIATRDAPEDVRRRVANLLDPSQGAEVTSVVVGVDWEGTWDVDAYAVLLRDARIRVVRGHSPGGKALALNAAVEASPSSDYLLIADTHQVFEEGAIGHLVSRTATEMWDGASGVVRPLRQSTATRLWQLFELGIRAGQSAGNGLVTTSGAITLLRRQAWKPIPAGAICDDLYLSTGTALRGGKIGLSHEAIAVDPRIVTPRQAFQKKVRTLTGLWQYVLVLEPDAIDPRRNPLWFDFFSHKVMRLLTPFMSVIAAAAFVAAYSSTSARPLPVARSLLIVAILALPPLFVPSARWRVATFFAPMIATWNALRGNWSVWNIAGIASPK